MNMPFMYLLESCKHGGSKLCESNKLKKEEAGLHQRIVAEATRLSPKRTTTSFSRQIVPHAGHRSSV